MSSSSWGGYSTKRESCCWGGRDRETERGIRVSRDGSSGSATEFLKSNTELAQLPRGVSERCEEWRLPPGSCCSRKRVVSTHPHTHPPIPATQPHHTHPITTTVPSVIFQVHFKLRWMGGLELSEVLCHQLVVGRHRGGVVDVLAADVEPVPRVAAHTVSNRGKLAKGNKKHSNKNTH
ncbi:hypothetical protein E2C01_023567 [Portunus trituberculatus]|uniref:Uncharacterized protein n=1 Tax=Portunus trituberculatus TaxID=210409 RepID=A0A5B7EAW4_PORTR|nr:hypothetical protein [Portunus trituberculatus]